MAFLRTSLFIFLVIVPSLAQACPACLISETDRLTNQNLFILAAMGVIPLVVALILGFRISRLCRDGRNEGGENPS